MDEIKWVWVGYIALLVLLAAGIEGIAAEILLSAERTKKFIRIMIDYGHAPRSFSS